MMHDFIGRTLEVGDEVATDSPYYKGLVRAEVVGFTPKRIRVKLITSNNSFYTIGRELLREPSAVSKL